MRFHAYVLVYFLVLCVDHVTGGRLSPVRLGMWAARGIDRHSPWGAR